MKFGQQLAEGSGLAVLRMVVEALVDFSDQITKIYQSQLCLVAIVRSIQMVFKFSSRLYLMAALLLKIKLDVKILFYNFLHT